MDELDQKRAADHLDLYRYDGRSYDISEEKGVLTLQLRHSVCVERRVIVVLAVVLNLIMVMTLAWFLHAELEATFTKTGSQAARQFWIQLSTGLGIGYVMRMKAGKVWKFDKNANKVHYNTIEITDFSAIRGVRAWQRGSKFHIALQLRFGRTQKLDFFAFSRSERAWRDDASQIAAFMGVPLEIPPVIE